MLISCSSITKNFTGTPLFDGLSLTIEEGCKLGIIGRNGCGKSTLLSIVGKRQDPDAGDVALRRGVRVAFVEQTTNFDGEKTVTEILEAASLKAIDSIPEERNKLVSLLKSKAGLPDTQVKNLSGGLNKRLAIAAALAEAPDVMLLDEPTNHLDIKGILWLEGVLKNAKFAWVVVTHDRWFLQKTVQQILEINKTFPKGYFVTEGDYYKFQEKREAFIEAQKKERDTLANKVRRETEWLHQGAKARSTKAKYRSDTAHAMIEELRETNSRLRESTTEIAFNSSDRKTKKLIELKGVTKSIEGKTLFKDQNLILSPGMRLGLLGVNGCGKTTLLNVIAKRLEADSGEVVHAPNLRIAVFNQNRSQLKQDWSLRRALSEHSDSVVFNGQSIHINSWATKFGFRVDQLDLPVSELSGGEQARLAIAQIMLVPADVLLLDEPTNDLDIPALEALEDSLAEFSGAVVLVTHDRYLIDRVCDSFIGFSDGNAKPFADYAQWEKSLTVVAKPQNTTPKVERSARPAQKKLTYMEEKELASMEDTIFKAEEELEQCKAALEDNAIMSDPEKAKEAAKAWEVAKEKVDKLYQRWEELEARATRSR